MPTGSFTHQTDLMGGKARLNKVCPNGRCRLGPTVHVQKTSAESHSAILHGLDRKVGKLLFSKEPFQPTVDAWNGVPLVFAQAHPEPKDPTAKINAAIFGLNRDFTQDELDRINGAIIGESSDAFIESTGHPKLMVTKNYTDETAIRMFGQGLITEDQLAKSQAAVPIALKLLAEGKLSHSSGFICPDDGEKLTGTVIPNHILEFEETPRDQPLDRMAVVLNKEENDVIGNSHTHVGKVLSNKNEGRLKTAIDSIMSIFEEIRSGADNPAAVAEGSKTNQEIVAIAGTMNTPDGESLEGQIENVRRALSDHIGMKWPDGTQRTVWVVMTMPDKVIWQHPDTSQYFATSYTVGDDGAITFGQPEEVEQAYVVKEANTVFYNMTAEDIDTIVKRNKQTETTMTPEEIAAQAAAQKQKDDAIAAKDAQIAQLQKERDDLAAAQAQVQTEKDDAQWGALKSKYIPPGMVKDPADEAALRKLCKDDPPAFTEKILAARADPKFPEEGSGHVSGPDAKLRETQEIDRILKSTGRAVPGTLH